MTPITDVEAELVQPGKSPAQSHFPPENQRSPYPGSRGPNMATMKPFSCPMCGSDRIQKATILTRARISLSTEVTRILSPPVEPISTAEPAGRFSICIGALLFTIGFYTLVTIHIDHIGLFLQTMGVILVLLGISLLALSQLEINSKRPKYKEDYAKWERMWYCSHCRNTFYDT